MPHKLWDFPLCELQTPLGWFFLQPQVVSLHGCSDYYLTEYSRGPSTDLWSAVFAAFSSLVNSRCLGFPGFQFYFLNSERPLGFVWVPPPCTVQEVSLGNHRAHLISVPSLRDYCSSLTGIQCLENCCFLHRHTWFYGTSQILRGFCLFICFCFLQMKVCSSPALSDDE